LDEPQASENKVVKIKPETKQQPKAGKPSKGIEAEFESLFDALKNSIAETNSQGMDSNAIKQLFYDTLKEAKISYSDLDADVQRRFASLPVVIRYELPERSFPSFTKPPISSFQQMIDDILLGHNVLLIGGAGTGKTFLAETLISKQALGRQYITINCSQWTSPTEIIGGQTMDGYVEGKLIEAWKNGWVMILDELPKLDPNTAGLFNDALSKTILKDAMIFNARKESFQKHPDFACVATGNIYPNKESISYGANNKQDLSLLDRFSGSVFFVEKNPDIERQIIQNELLWSICNKMRDAIEELKYEAQLSLRFMQTARDAFHLEMMRLNSKKSKGIAADDGKTFKSAVDSFLSTFTEIQQGQIKAKIDYNAYLSRFQYRNLDPSKQLYSL
jgi:cobaltochelatase CobS